MFTGRVTLLLVQIKALFFLRGSSRSLVRVQHGALHSLPGVFFYMRREESCTQATFFTMTDLQ